MPLLHKRFNESGYSLKPILALFFKRWYIHDMSEILDNVIELIRRGELLISSHGYDELASDGI